MYEFILTLHNILRWVVLVLAIAAVINAGVGWLKKRGWTDRDRKIGVFYTMGMDVQLLLGLVLYFFLSPFGLKAILDQGMSFIMGSEVQDYPFFGIEHIFTMLVAVVLAHVGNALSKKAPEAPAKFKRAFLFYGLSLLVLLVGIPWWRSLI